MSLGGLIERASDYLSPTTMGKLYRTTPRWVTDRLALDGFRRTVRWAGRHSPFYRRAFAELGIDPNRVRRPADLKDFYTTPDDLASRASEFLCRTPNIVFESSGTSGRNKQVYFGKDELEVIGKSMAAGMGLMGLRPEDRVANAFDFSIWIPGLITHYALMSAGTFCLAFGKVDPVEVWRRIKQYEFNVVMGEPTWLIRLTELAERDGGGKLKMMIGGAEEMPEKAVAWMKSVWEGVEVKMCYGSVEQGSSIAFQPCANHDGYHLDNVDFLPEIIEQDEAGYGELVFTTLRRRTMPLIRYRTRDVTCWQKPCACGMPAPRISKIRGRRDELIVASGGNLYPLMFENILKHVPSVGVDFQVVFTLEDVREILTICVESTRDDHDALFEQIKEVAGNLYPDLMKNLALGIFEMRLSISAPGSIRKGRKLRRMIDRRHFFTETAATEGIADEQLV